MATPGEKPLERWKEIADYLRRSERTVQRWERKGLPVHRHDIFGVIAYRSELDVWLKTVESARNTTQGSAMPTPAFDRSADAAESNCPPETGDALTSQTDPANPDNRSARTTGHQTAFLGTWWRKFAFVGSGTIVFSALVIAVLKPAYGLAILAFGLGAVFVLLSYMCMEDTPTARAVVALYMLAGMCYIASASTMPEFHSYVVNADALPPSVAYLVVVGLKFVPLFFLVLLYWVLLGCSGDVGLSRRPVWDGVYVLLGILFLVAELLLVSVALGDDRVLRAGVPGQLVLLSGSIVALAVNVTVWLIARHYFRQEKITSYRPLFSVCAIAYLIVAVASFFVDHEHNLLNRYYLDVRWPEAYVSRNPGAIDELRSLGPQTRAEIGPDLASLLRDPAFDRALRTTAFYKQHSDEPFQIFHRSVMFGYKPRSPGASRQPFVTIRLPKALADALRFEPVAESK